MAFTLPLGGNRPSRITSEALSGSPQASEGFLLPSVDATVIPFPGADVPPAHDEDVHLPPIVAVGGLFTIDELHWIYGKLLARDGASQLSSKDRFIAPYHHGVAPIEELRNNINERVLRVADRLGEKIYGVGHSLGGLLLTWAAMDNPDVFAGVTCVAGAQEGIRKHTLASKGLRWIAGSPKEAELLRHDSSFMQEHLAQVEEEWPEGVLLDIASTSLDEVIVAPQGFGLRPKGQEPSKRLIVSSWHAVDPITRHIMRKMPEGVKPLRTSAPIVEHVNIVRSRVLLDHVDRRRRAIANAHQQASASAS